MTTLFGQVISAKEVAPSLVLSCDVIIVGMSSAGALLMRELVAAGLRVIGVDNNSSRTKLDPESAHIHLQKQNMLAESGARCTEDGEIHLVQDRGIGASSLTSVNVCRRIPRNKLKSWEEEYGINCTTFEDALDHAEKFLIATPIPPNEINKNNALVWLGMRKLGYRGGPLFSSNLGDCCETKLSDFFTDPAVAKGALVLTNAKVERILHDKNVASSVIGTLHDPNKAQPIGEFKLNASAIVLAASAIGSASIALRSKLPDPFNQLGKHLHLQPRTTVLGAFPQIINMWEGRQASIECSEFLDVQQNNQQRIWMIADAVSYPEAAMLFPGFGPKHADKMMQLHKNAALRIIIQDQTEGHISLGIANRIRVHYRIPNSERNQLAFGLREAAKILLAAGAEEVLVHGGKEGIIRKESELSLITGEILSKVPLPLSTTGSSSTMRLHYSSRFGIVDTNGKHHFIPNIYVADASVFPSAVGVPLLLSTVAWAFIVSKTIIKDLLE